MSQPAQAEAKPAPEPAPATTTGGGDGADETHHAEQMYKDLRVKDLSFFTGTWGDQAKWPRLLVFCASDIPLTHDEYKKVAVMRKVPARHAHRANPASEARFNQVRSRTAAPAS